MSLSKHFSCCFPVPAKFYFLEYICYFWLELNPLVFLCYFFVEVVADAPNFELVRLLALVKSLRLVFWLLFEPFLVELRVCGLTLTTKCWWFGVWSVEAFTTCWLFEPFAFSVLNWFMLMLTPTLLSCYNYLFACLALERRYFLLCTVLALELDPFL